jgi:hypothetical protein
LLTKLSSVVIAGGPHAIIWTHADEVNHALLDFIADPDRARGRQRWPHNQPQGGSENGQADRPCG